jgi:hypothetical protein
VRKEGWAQRQPGRQLESSMHGTHLEPKWNNGEIAGQGGVAIVSAGRSSLLVRPTDAARRGSSCPSRALSTAASAPAARISLLAQPPLWPRRRPEPSLVYTSTLTPGLPCLHRTFFPVQAGVDLDCQRLTG